jgi:hypothetical protein
MNFEVAYYFKLLGLAVGVVVVRLLLGFGYLTGPDVKYIFDSRRPLLLRLGLLLLLVLVAFAVVLFMAAWYGGDWG